MIRDGAYQDSLNWCPMQNVFDIIIPSLISLQKSSLSISKLCFCMRKTNWLWAHTWWIVIKYQINILTSIEHVAFYWSFRHSFCVELMSNLHANTHTNSVLIRVMIIHYTNFYYCLTPKVKWSVGCMWMYHHFWNYVSRRRIYHYVYVCR